MARGLIPTEHDEQVALIDWWNNGAAHAYGLTIYHLFAIPNAGAGASKGQAGKMKAEGTRAGIPDLFLAVPRLQCPGLFIEMKRRDGGRLSLEQQLAIQALSRQGYRCVVCKGADEAIRAIRDYLA